MDIDPKHRISTEGFQEQDAPFFCPECGFDLSIKNTIGFGEYPKGGFRSMMKPGNNLAHAFECPKCFTKSVHHANDYSYQLYLDSLGL